ncbi:hypothetical protein FHS68_000387 [Dyadobacter arcticus]|uniref:Uncharacterized protein n=1 Tax=Dyadobacter arcticus TaxID=1078754 RepID=A0ABX0UJ61_9BACT|nr:hypothetical protein [Dyadobacter arcticus]
MNGCSIIMKQILAVQVGRENNSVVTSQIADGTCFEVDQTFRSELYGVRHQSNPVRPHHFEYNMEKLTFGAI